MRSFQPEARRRSSHWILRRAQNDKLDQTDAGTRVFIYGQVVDATGVLVGELKGSGGKLILIKEAAPGLAKGALTGATAGLAM